MWGTLAATEISQVAQLIMMWVAKMEIQEKAENNTATHKWGNMGGSLWLYTYCWIFQKS